MPDRFNAVAILLIGGAAALIVASVVATILIVASNDPNPVRTTVVARPTQYISERVTPELIRALGFGVLPPVVMPPDNPATAEKIELG